MGRQTCRSFYNKLKEALAKNPVLAYPDPNLPFTIYTDASDVGVGAILAQTQDGVEKVVQYLSRKLDSTERKYAASEKECLGVVWAIEKCRPYIWGRHFTVVTDCSALRFLMTTASPNGRLIRWAMRLSEYDFTVQYRKGSSNANADALSRLFSGASLEERYSQVVGEPAPEVPIDVEAMEVDTPITSDHIKQHCNETLLPQVRVTEGRAGSYWKDHEGNEYCISAILDYEDEDEWDLLLTTNSGSELEPWLDEDLEDGMADEEEEHDDEDDTVKSFTDVLSKLKEEQEQDEEYCGPLINALKKGGSPNDLPKKYKLSAEGHLMYQSNEGGRWRLVIPSNLRKILLYEHHAAPHAAHVGRDRTRESMTSRYYWPNMVQEIDEWVGTCAVCVRRKPSPYGRVGQLHPLTVKEPFGMWGMDLLELQKSKRGNKYLLIMTDYFTRWVEAIPLPNKEAITVAGVIYREIFCRYGAPESILTDQGKEFNNALLSTLCLAYGVRKLLTIKKSSTNGLTERFNRTLWDMFAKKGKDEQLNWDQHINACLYAYRSTVQASTKKSPYEVMFGQPMKLPTDVAISSSEPPKMHDRYRILRGDFGVGNEEFEAEALNQARLNTKKLLEEQAAKALTRKQQAQQERWMKKARELKMLLGQKVHIRSERGQGDVPAKKAKLSWEGPYTILELRERGNILVQKDHTPNAKPEVWHIQNVKPAWERQKRERKKPLKLRDRAVGMLDAITGSGESHEEPTIPLMCFRLGPAREE